MFNDWLMECQSIYGEPSLIKAVKEIYSTIYETTETVVDDVKSALGATEPNTDTMFADDSESFDDILEFEDSLDDGFDLK